jgi:uncharacterized membrane protein
LTVARDRQATAGIPGRFARSRAANIATLTALTMPVMLSVAAFAIDEGSLFLERRELQAAADIAAIEAASDPANAQTAATAALAGNGAEPANAALPAEGGEARNDIRLSVETGVYAPDPATPAAQRFTAGAAQPNAARVSLVATGTRYFAGALIPPPTIAVAATAARIPQATLSVGSRLAALDGGALNAALGALTGSSLSLSLMDYEALAAADVSLLGALDALRTDLDLQAATYGDLLKSKIGLGRFVSALDRSGSMAVRVQTAFSQLTRSLSNTDRIVPLASLLDLGAYDRAPVGDRSAGPEPVANALDLVSAAALLAVANGRHQVELGLDAAASGLAGVSATLAVGEPPQGSSVFRTGTTGALVRTAQLRLLARLRIASGVLPASVELPVTVELAPAEARIAAISCSAGGADAPAVTVEARPGLARLRIGEPARLADWSKAPSYASARMLDAPLVKVTGDARVEIASPDFSTLRFAPADIGSGTVKRVATGRIAGALTRSLLSDLRLQTSVAGLSLGLGDATKAALGALLAQTAPAIDDALDGLLALLGLRIGEADVRVTSASCGRPVLVQ